MGERVRIDLRRIRGIAVGVCWLVRNDEGRGLRDGAVDLV